MRLFLISMFLIFTNIYSVFGETIKPDWWYNSCYYECYSIFGCHLFCDEIRKLVNVATNLWLYITGSEYLPINGMEIFLILLFCFIIVLITLIVTIIDIVEKRKNGLGVDKEDGVSTKITLLNIFQIISLFLSIFLLVCVILCKTV